MRIIAGEFRGRPLKVPEGKNTRPTTDRVREAFMSSLFSLRGGFQDAVILDAFAGSGALSFEALSRGAAFAVLYEQNRSSARLIRENMHSLGLGKERVSLQVRDIFGGALYQAAKPYDLLFLDPPYAYAPQLSFGLVEELFCTGLSQESLLAVYEHAAGDCEKIDEGISALKRVENELLSRKKYGDTVVDIFRFWTR